MMNMFTVFLKSSKYAPIRRVSLAVILASSSLESYAFQSEPSSKDTQGVLLPAQHIEQKLEDSKSQPFDSSNSLAEALLYLDLVINNRARNVTLEIKVKEGRWYARRDELFSLNISWPLPLQEWILLDELPKTTWQYTEEVQRLTLFTDPSFLPVQNLNQLRAESEPAARSTGAFINYSALSSFDGSTDSSTSIMHEANIFTSKFHFYSSGINFFSTTEDNQQKGYTRFETRLTYEMEKRRAVIQVGDVFNQGREHLPSYRVGGIRIARDFSLEPDRVNFPLPEFIGMAEVPSGLDLWINNQKTQLTEVDSGPFMFDLQNALSGYNSATVVTQDLQGRPVSQTLNFYISNRLLRKGLLDYDIVSGYVRDDYGIENLSYGEKILSSVRLSYGVTSSLTAELTAQHYESKTNVSAGLTVAVFNAGTLNATLSQSKTDSEGDGAKTRYYGYDFYRGGFGVFANYQKRDQEYLDVVTYSRLGQTKEQIGVGVSQSLRSYGQLSFNFTKRSYWKTPVFEDINPIVPDFGVPPGVPNYIDRDAVEFIQLAWYKALNKRAMISTRWQRSNPGKSDLFSLNFSYNFGSNLSATYQNQHRESSSSQYLSMQKSTEYPYGAGWGFSVSDEPGKPYYVDARLRHRYGNGVIRHQRSLENQTTMLDWAGSVVFMDREFFLSSPIYDAFAVVSTGMPNVPVYSGFQAFGASSSQGRRLIPDVASYQTHQVSVDPLDLPENISLEDAKKSFRAKRGGGVLVDFDLKVVTQVQVKIVDEDQNPLPAGTTLTTKNDQSLWVGFDGEVFIDSAVSHQELRWDEGKCSVVLPTLNEGESNDLAPLVCKPTVP